MKAVFFDIDGTLAIKTTVPDSAKKAIELLRNNGHLVFICTGRALAYVKEYFSDYADGFICSNGRFAIYQDQILYDHPMTQEEVEYTHKVIKDNNAGIIYFEQDHGYCDNPLEPFEESEKVWKPNYLVNSIPDTLRPYNFDVYFKDIEHMNTLQKALGDHYILNSHMPHPSADVTITGIDKGTALQHVAKALNIALEDTYAFGDSYNDICMFNAAGTAIAMGNGVQEAKMSADYITTDILDHGVYNALKHFRLI